MKNLTPKQIRKLAEDFAIENITVPLKDMPTDIGLLKVNLQEIKNNCLVVLR